MHTIFVAAGHNGERIMSVDSIQWSALEKGRESDVYRAVAFGNGRCITVGSSGGENIFATTTDGVRWESGKKDAKYVQYIRGLGFDGKKFIGIGGDPGSVGSSKPFICTTTDGTLWSDPVEIGGKMILRRLAFGNGVIVGVGDRGRRSVSKDGGTTWTDAPDTKPIDTLVDVAYGAGKFVGVGLHSLRMTSTDGLSWSAPVRGAEGEHLNNILWTGDRFVAIGQTVAFFSPDGEKWERKETVNGPLTSTYGNGVFAGSQWRGRLLSSKDAITWTEVYKGDEHFEAIGFGEVS